MKAMPYDLFYKQKYDEGRLAWNLIKRVEIGIEATAQLIVQLYVLSPLALQFVQNNCVHHDHRPFKI